MTDDLYELRYPLGEFTPPELIDRACVDRWIEDIDGLPRDLRATLAPLTPEQLDTRYRPDGWTVRQVVHHVADSHMNSFVRFKWALTEERPVIKPYDEARAAELADYGEAMPLTTTLDFLDALHARWVAFLRLLTDEQLDREFVHPESRDTISLRRNVGIYAWHGRHHLAHVRGLVDREGWGM